MTIDLDELERLAAAARCDFSEETSRFLDAVSPDVVRELIARVRAAESGATRRCTCDDFCEGPCPRHGVENLQQNVRLMSEELDRVRTELVAVHFEIGEGYFRNGAKTAEALSRRLADEFAEGVYAGAYKGVRAGLEAAAKAAEEACWKQAVEYGHGDLADVCFVLSTTTRIAVLALDAAAIAREVKP